MNRDESSIDFLFSDDASRAFSEVLSDQEFGKNLIQITKKLRKEFSPQQTSQILQQYELRQRAKSKFTKSENMFFLRKQLEQATNEVISFYKSRRFEKMNRVVDLCCGIGGDAIGLAENRNLTIVDLDLDVVSFAERNVEAYGFSVIPTACDVMEVNVATFDAFHIDPDRRVDGNRSTKSEFFCPEKQQLEAMSKSNPNFAMKLAPATRSWLDNCEREFIGFDRECKQQVLWSGVLSTQSGIRATSLDRSGNPIDSFFEEVADSNDGDILTSEHKRFIYDPHPCLVAARLVNAFGRRNSLSRLTHDTVYLTGDQMIQNSLVQCFELIESCVLDESLIKKLLEKYDVGELELKKRGVELDVMKRFSKLKCIGSKRATLIMAPTRDGFRGMLCDRVANPG